MCEYWASKARAMMARVPATSVALAASASPNSATRTRPPLHRRDSLAVMCVSPSVAARCGTIVQELNGLCGPGCREAPTLTSPDHRRWFDIDWTAPHSGSDEPSEDQARPVISYPHLADCSTETFSGDDVVKGVVADLSQGDGP